jgi:hypothetical protein
MAKRRLLCAVLLARMVSCAMGVEVPRPTLPEKTAVPSTMSAGVEEAAVEVALCPTLRPVRTRSASAVVYPASETAR